MISLKEVTLKFGQQKVFDNINCNISIDSKIGLVGRNGSGKSTMLKAVVGAIPLDAGEITIAKGIKIGYVPQEVTLLSDKGIFDEAFSVFTEINQILAQLDVLEPQINAPNPDPKIIEQYSQLHLELQQHDVAQDKLETERILLGLGFLKKDFANPVSELSVGWKMRIVLAKLLLMRADFYLFDEPTNHLDILAADWFLGFLKKSTSGFMLVCHDRYFLDHLCDQILELSGGVGTMYYGNYSKYVQDKETNEAVLRQRKQLQDKEIAQQIETAQRFKAKASKAKMAKSMLAKIDKIERIEVPKEQRKIHVRFPSAVKAGKTILTVKDLQNRFENKQTFTDISFEIKNGEKVGLIASNGVGKTTLLNLIMGKLPLQKGSVTFGYNVVTAYFEQDQNLTLDGNKTIWEEVSASCKMGEAEAMMRPFLGAFLFSGEDINKKIRVLSGGEKNRVAMVKVLLQQANFLILDEPTNHLDVETKQILVDALKDFNGTILFVSHDRDFLDKLATSILELTPTHMVNYEGNYESYVYHKKMLAQMDIPMAGSTTKKAAATQPADAPTTTLGGRPLANTDDMSADQAKAVKRVEGVIATLEKKIRDLNMDLAAYDMESSLYTMTVEKIDKAKKQLNDAIVQWEKLTDTV